MIGIENKKMGQVPIEKREIMSGYKEITDLLEWRGAKKVKRQNVCR